MRKVRKTAPAGAACSAAAAAACPLADAAVCPPACLPAAAAPPLAAEEQLAVSTWPSAHWLANNTKVGTPLAEFQKRYRHLMCTKGM